MCKNKLINILIPFMIVCFFGPHVIFADEVSITSSTTISARVIPSSGNGGSSGSKIAQESISTIINFSGKAHPFSKVYILKDGNIVLNTTADQFANFSATITGLKTNIYTFYIYAEDQNGKRSSLFSIPIFITYGTIVDISNIFLSPTIAVDKTVVKKGEKLFIFGKSIPNKEVNIYTGSNKEYIYKTISDAMGNYLYNFDSSNFEIGRYKTKSKSFYNNQQSMYSLPVIFFIKDKIKNESHCLSLRVGDLNCDDRVNLVDFSIMAYWYKKVNPPQRVDLSGDKQINLVDFSIMMFNWTG